MLVVLSLGFVPRLALVLLVPNVQYSDSAWYDAAAARLVERGEYGVDGPSAWFSPGWPFFLATVYAVCGHDQIVGKVANAALGAVACAVTFVVGRSLFGARAGWLAALILADWPNLVFHAAVLSAETFLSCALVSLLGLTACTSASGRWRCFRGAAIGLLLGWTALARPAAIFLFAWPGLIELLAARSARRVAAAAILPALIATLCVAAWTYRNYARFGEFIPVATSGGYNVWQVNHRFANGNDTFWPSVPADDPEYRTMCEGGEFVKNREGYRYARAYLRSHPWHPLTLAPSKLFWIYHTDTSGLYEAVLNTPMSRPSRLIDWLIRHRRTMESLTFRYYQAVMAVAVGSLAFAPVGKRRGAWLLASVPLIWTAFHLLVHAKDRFHVPLSPFFALLAGMGMTVAWDAVARGTVAVSGPRRPAGWPIRRRATSGSS